METGSIAQLFRDKGYGSIRTDEGKSVHFHRNCLFRIRFDELNEGQKVKFFTQQFHNGLMAFEIQNV